MNARIDISGETFGRWKALRYVGDGKYECECECGTRRDVGRQHLKSGHSQSCGCFKAERTSANNSADIAGKRFGRLIAVERRGSTENYQAKWLGQCDCGKTKITIANRLVSGKTRSCGCLQRQISSKHSKSRTRTYRIWMKLKGRCNNSNDGNWKHYGGRGIKVCARWQQSFDNFLADMGEAPSTHSIDRINVNGNYEPGNCRWATAKQQTNNTRRNKFVVVDGVELPLAKALEQIKRAAFRKYDLQNPGGGRLRR